MTVNFIFILTYMFETIVDICLMRSLVGKKWCILLSITKTSTYSSLCNVKFFYGIVIFNFVWLVAHTINLHIYLQKDSQFKLFGYNIFFFN